MMTTDGGAQAGARWTEEHWQCALDNALYGGPYARETAEEILREYRALAAQAAALTAARDRLRAALVEHAVWRDWEGSDNFRCRICHDGAPERDLILHALTCPLRVLSLAEWLDRRATTPPAGAQEHEHDWQPAGFTPHPASGGLMPTDQCRVCGAVRYPYSPDVQP